MTLNVFSHNIQVIKKIIFDFYTKIIIIFIDLWFGLPGTLEALDRLAREFFDASSSNDETNQKSLLEKAREQVKGLVDKKEQKRYLRFFITLS